MFWGYFCEQISCQELSKIDQSCHTDQTLLGTLTIFLSGLYSTAGFTTLSRKLKMYCTMRVVVRVSLYFKTCLI